MTTSGRTRSLPGAAATAAAPAGLVLLAVAAVVLAVDGGLDRPADPLSALVDTGASGLGGMLRAVLLAATAVSAGVGLLSGLGAGAAGPARVAWTAAGVTTAACLFAVVTGGASRPVAAVHVLLTLLVAVLLGSPWPRTARTASTASTATVAALALAGLLGAQLGAWRTGVPLALDLVYALAASVLSGATLAWAGLLDAPRAVRLVLPSALLAAGAGLAQLALTGPPAGHDVTHTGAGLTALAQAVLPLLVGAAWLVAAKVSVLREAAGPLAQGCVAAAVVAVAAATVPATLPSPAAPEPGVASARAVDLPGRHLAVLVAPMRPGPNLVHVAVAGGATGANSHSAHSADPADPADHDAADPGSFTVGAGGAEVALTTRPGATGLWAVLDIPAGTDRIELAENGARRYAAGVPVEVGAEPGDPALAAALTGPDGPECASVLLAGLLAGPAPRRAAPSQCPSQTLTTADADALRDTVAFLAGRGVTGLNVAADDSVRGEAAAALVRAEAAARDLPVRDDVPGDTLLVVSGWSAAVPALGAAEALARESATGGVVLAPWLLNGPVLAAASSQVLALPFDPGGAAARRYGAVVAATFPGDGPSTSGYLAWLQAGGAGEPPARVAFYGAAPVNVPMGMDHGPGSGAVGAWYPTGTVVAISPPLGPAGSTP